ncbi:TRAP transporter small permease [Pusillimonas sp. DMV24BSW_D]|uniref:TRAP transporter small permease n=1 Tax=Neopusillimonas aestuarii TaxID=2716226 RepID=UPI000C6B2BEF|nr:TRAP transporter small permease [Pusillimonas sp. DMV24BSW_D]MAY65504.1 integral membrane transport protein [Rhodospirillaceae bacterium]QIM49293.1 TRAP transporter small permease [Pusillimonas sp. DMV24BSW_D]|tara:strand:+ start:110 stop:634 length:525 start_codon:yes stop_codon:yes gene_type:complete
MRNMLSTVGRAWDRLEIFIGGLFLTLSVFIIVLQIFLRSVFGFSIIGGDEIAAYAIIWSILFTAALAVKSNQHVRIDVIFTVLPKTAGRILDMIGTLLSLFFALYLTYSGWELVMESHMLGEVSMTMLRMPMWIPQVILPLGGALLSLRLIQRFVSLLTGAADPQSEQAESSAT